MEKPSLPTPGQGPPDPPADTVDTIHRQLHQAEMVRHHLSARVLLIDGVAVPLERVQGGDLDCCGEAGAALVEPPGMDRPGPPGHQIQQAGR